MDWEKFATVFGLPGLMIAAAVMVLREIGARQERIRNLELADKKEIRLRELAVEDKKADAMVTAMSSITNRIEAHHTADLQSHQELATGIAEIRGQLDAWQDRTPVNPPPTRNTPVRGVPAIGGEYTQHNPRARSRGDGGG